ncbi:MAG: hypothetical protein MZV63_15130 [Marinilabiliales bacterium]|nr:hypothetical protein [Marinilabiliales bacterium]
MSDSNGFIYDKDGINEEKLAWVMDLKNVRRGRIKEYADKFGAQVRRRPASVGRRVRLRVPLRHAERDQRRRRQDAAGQRLLPGLRSAPTCPPNPAAIDQFLAKKILYGPGKAANAGGVATSGLEMCQNSMRLPWTREEVDQRLHHIMVTIHKNACDDRRGIRPAGQLRGRRQHRRLRQGSPTPCSNRVSCKRTYRVPRQGRGQTDRGLCSGSSRITGGQVVLESQTP